MAELNNDIRVLVKDNDYLSKRWMPQLSVKRKSPDKERSPDIN